MPNLLTVLASPRGDYSVSRSLAATFTQAFEKAHTDTQTVTRDLYQSELPFVDLPWIAGAFTPAEQHSPEMKKALDISNTLIAELQAADHILIATPMYNFSIPAIVKAWLDHVVRIGVTVSAQYEGQLKGKKATVIIASSGDYAPGSPSESYNHETSYLKFILGFIGLTDVTFVMAGGTRGINTGATTMEAVVAQYAPAVEAAAA